MINIRDEELLTLVEAARRVPHRPHIATLHRWVARGVRNVRLEAVRIGGRTYTSTEALQRFVDRLSASRAVTAQPECSSDSNQRAEKAEEQLKQIGI